MSHIKANEVSVGDTLFIGERDVEVIDKSFSGKNINITYKDSDGNEATVKTVHNKKFILVKSVVDNVLDYDPDKDLPEGYRWAKDGESDSENAIVVPLTQDSNGVEYEDGEADIAVPIDDDDDLGRLDTDYDNVPSGVGKFLFDANIEQYFRRINKVDYPVGWTVTLYDKEGELITKQTWLNIDSDNALIQVAKSEDSRAENFDESGTGTYRVYAGR